MNDLSWPMVFYAWALSTMCEWWPAVFFLWACVRAPPCYSQYTIASTCESTPAIVWMLGSTVTQSGSIPKQAWGNPATAKGNGWAGGEKHCLCFFSSTDPYWVPGLLCGCGCPSHISPPLLFLPPSLPHLEAESDSLSPGSNASFSFASFVPCRWMESCSLFNSHFVNLSSSMDTKEVSFDFVLQVIQY